MKMADVSRETGERLKIYIALLLKWNARINLIGRATESGVVHRHIDDSLQLVDHAPAAALNWVDLGSGAGLPGLVLAIALAELRPSATVTLVECDQRKAAFLSVAARETGTNTRIVTDRIEIVPKMNAELLTARALAPLPRLLELSSRHLAHDGVCLFPKGVAAESELTEALRQWHMSVETFPSATDPSGVILRIGDLARA
jgi:16S rRNA (guanine527-N7)-methyltransferase